MAKIKTPKPVKPEKQPKKQLALPVSTLSANHGATPIIDPPLPHHGREVINPNRQYPHLKKAKKS
jgi:hypothetical protein